MYTMFIIMNCQFKWFSFLKKLKLLELTDYVYVEFLKTHKQQLTFESKRYSVVYIIYSWSEKNSKQIKKLDQNKHVYMVQNILQTLDIN